MTGMAEAKNIYVVGARILKAIKFRQQDELEFSNKRNLQHKDISIAIEQHTQGSL